MNIGRPDCAVLSGPNIPRVPRVATARYETSRMAMANNKQPDQFERIILPSRAAKPANTVLQTDTGNKVLTVLISDYVMIIAAGYETRERCGAVVLFYKTR